MRRNQMPPYHIQLHVRRFVTKSEVRPIRMRQNRKCDVIIKLDLCTCKSNTSIELEVHRVRDCVFEAVSLASFSFFGLEYKFSPRDPYNTF